VKKLDWLASSLSSVGILAAAFPAWTQEMGQNQTVPRQRIIAQAKKSVSKLPVYSVAPERSPSLLISSIERDNPMEQVTSVSQLSDVRPTDWAFEAVRSLVERYGIISGYPDGTFRGNRPLSRNELAAVLTTILGRIEVQLIAGQANSATKQDILTIRRLISSYGDALADVRNRLNRIENRTERLEGQQFSTTTKLSGRTDLIATDGTDANLTVIARVRLNLATSFQGTDRLITQLEAGNNGRDAIAQTHDQQQNLLGTTGILADGGGIDAVGATSDIKIRKLYYAFRPAENLEVAVGSNIPPSDFIDRNSFANQSGENVSSSFFANNPLIVQNEIDRFGGAGTAIAWSPGKNFTLRALYIAADASDPANGGGLFRDRYQASAEAEYSLSNQPFTVRLQYTNANINGTEINAGGINAEWAIRRRFGVVGLFGRFGFGRYRGFNTVLAEDLDLDPKSWAFGLSFQNFLIPGSKAGVAIGQPFITRKLGNATQTNFEAFFGLLINDNLNVSPSLLVVNNPNNRSSPMIWQWSLRLLYSF
jgi:hypothetical protein